MISLKTLTKCLCATILLVQTAPSQPAFAGSKGVVKVQTMQKKMTRRISPAKGRVVPRGTILKAPGGTLALTCCTHWNTQSGGTGCASFDDSEEQCPADTFQVECGSSGCW